MFASANLGFLFKEAGPLLQRYEAAAKAGFRFVECDFPVGLQPSQLQEATRKNGVQQILINCFQGNNNEMGFGATPGQEDEFRKALILTLDYAKATNCKKIHISSGIVLGPERLQDQMNTFEANLKWAADFLAKEGITGLIEPINAISKPGYFLNSFEKAVSVIERVSSPNIRLQLDLFHLQFISGNITNNIKRLIPLTGHIQVAQTPHRHEPSFPGEMNMEYVFAELKKAGYEGGIGCEYIPSTPKTSDSLSWITKFGLTF